MEIGISRLSSKGQIIIPKELRNRFEQGEEIVFIESEGKILLKSLKEFKENLKEDLEFAKNTDEALERIEKGEYVEEKFDDFIDNMKKW